MRFFLIILVSLALVSLAGCIDAFRPAADLSDLSDGWNEIAGGRETMCSDGSEYHFFARPGSPEKLLVYFMGGGACWNGLSCDPDLSPSYVRTTENLDPNAAHGILAFDEEANPFRDHSVIVAPYCSGDVHLGNTTTAYEGPTTRQHAGHDFEIEHRGYLNASAVLEWVFARFSKPESLFVAGSSAGSIPSPYYAMLLAEKYPDAQLSQLGDGSSGYRREFMTSIPEASWGTLDILRQKPEFGEVQLSEFTNETLYTVAASRFPQHQFAAFDNAEDQIQKQFLELAGYRANTIREFIVANQNDIRAEVENYRSFLAGGTEHTILLRPEFYTLHVDGSTLRDWVAVLAEHEPINDVACRNCARAEYLEESETPAASVP